MIRGCSPLSLTLSLAVLLGGCATGATSKVSPDELATYKQWACSKCSTVKNKTSREACSMVCKKGSTY